jgi:hypothetical protein
VRKEESPEVDRDEQDQQHDGDDEGELNERLATSPTTGSQPQGLGLIHGW